LIETVSLGFEAGELGPGTIVGSAAFNLHIIIAICVAAIPELNKENPQEESGLRTVYEFGVFLITSGASLIAYL
jgi:hypothetical protein